MFTEKSVVKTSNRETYEDVDLKKEFYALHIRATCLSAAQPEI